MCHNFYCLKEESNFGGRVNELRSLGHVFVLCVGVRRIVRVPHTTFLLIMCSVGTEVISHIKSVELLPTEVEMNI